MTFARDVLRFVTQTKAVTREVYVSIATKAHASIKEGSAVTGAPGQPVDSGFLRNSWILAIGPTEARIQTNVAYAPVIEYNDRSQYNDQGKMPEPVEGVTRKPIKSTVGGHHSVRLTIAGASALQAQAVRELAR
jgi:hypothetical protein